MNAADGYRTGQVLYLDTAEGIVPVKIATLGERRTEVSLYEFPGRPAREIRTQVLELNLASPLKAACPAGTALSAGVPTPGAPNVY